MIKVNGWTDYSERIGDEVYNVSEDGYKTYKIEVFLSSPFDSSDLPIRTITVGSLEQVEKILKKERQQMHKEKLYIITMKNLSVSIVDSK